MDLPFTPAAAPPPDIVPDYEHPDSWRNLTIGVCATSAGLMIIAVSIRVFTKLYIMRTFNYEDYLLSIAFVFGLAYNFLCFSPSTIGAEHLYERPLAGIPDWLYYVNVISIMWPCCALFAKWSLLVQLSRVFAMKRYGGLWWMVRALIWTSSIAWIIIIFLTIFICNPREKIWEPSLPGHCINLYTTYICTASVNVAVNVFLLAITPIGLWRVKITPQQKLKVTAMFSVGVLGLGCAIGRLVATEVLLNSTDQTRAVAPEAYWASAELAFFILACVFPTLPRFWQWVRGRDKRGGYTAATAKSHFTNPQAQDAAVHNADIRMRAMDNGGGGRQQPVYAANAMAKVGAGRPADFARHDSRGNESGILLTVEVEVTNMV